jgi:hypothetical protein
MEHNKVQLNSVGTVKIISRSILFIEEAVKVLKGNYETTHISDVKYNLQDRTYHIFVDIKARRGEDT